MTVTWQPSFRAEARKEPTRPGCWDINNVSVLGADGQSVGAYKYNYSQTPPFFPFELRGQWYALYSKDYTASRVMKLPSCEDVWGEEGDACGFCPVQFYVPAVQEIDFGGDRTGKLRGTWHSDPEEFQEAHFDEKRDWTVQPVKFYDFGFVCGCVWGDDTSWKVRFFDFERIHDGVVTYDDRFGYIELNDNLTLQQSIKVWGGMPGERKGTRIQIVTPRTFTLDGKSADSIDE